MSAAKPLSRRAYARRRGVDDPLFVGMSGPACSPLR